MKTFHIKARTGIPPRETYVRYGNGGTYQRVSLSGYYRGIISEKTFVRMDLFPGPHGGCLSHCHLVELYKKRLESANDSVGADAVAVAAVGGPTDIAVEQVPRGAPEAPRQPSLPKVSLPENASTGNIEEKPSFLHQVLLPTFKPIFY